jgi:type I restriction enzyme S subunit
MNLPANALYIQVAKNWINDTEMVKLTAKPFPVGTTIFAKIGEALKANRLRFLIQPTILDNNMMGAIPTENEVDPRFFFYSLSQFDFGEIADGPHCHT